MSISIERPEITSFIANWKNKPPEQVAEELASYSLETKRIPDPYYFEISSYGKLLSPVTHSRVKDVVMRTNRIEELEYQALCFIEQWATNNQEGTIVWVSPPDAEVYPVSKIIISEIQQNQGQKRLFNRAILLDFDQEECCTFARNLAEYSQNRPLLPSLDQIRATPLILNTKTISWNYILQELIDDPKLWESIREGEDRIAKEQALRQARIVQKDLIAPNKTITSTEDVAKGVLQMLGSKGGSCPKAVSSSFKTFAENALTYSGLINKDPDFCKNCPVCGKEINCIVKTGGSCPECKAVKRCG